MKPKNFNYLPVRIGRNVDPENVQFSGMCRANALPETNMAPENNPLEKEIPTGTHHLYSENV